MLFHHAALCDAIRQQILHAVIPHYRDDSLAFLFILHASHRVPRVPNKGMWVELENSKEPLLEDWNEEVLKILPREKK